MWQCTGNGLQRTDGTLLGSQEANAKLDFRICHVIPWHLAKGSISRRPDQGPRETRMFTAYPEITEQ